MTLASDIVTSALRKIGAVDASEAVNAEDFETAAQALNRMATRWEANGLAFGWSNITSPSDVITALIEAENALIYNVALEIAPEYGLPVSGFVQQRADDELASLRRDRFVASPLYSTTDEPVSSGRYPRGWNIYSDSAR